MNLILKTHRHKGFTLIVTLSLMILLTVIAVGLLSLSSVSIRASGQGVAMATARANARLALMLAIGDLQKNLGPDQRISARADLIDAKNPKLSGVWSSWEIKASAPPTATEYNKATRDGKFLGWLVSSKDPAAIKKTDYAGSAPSDPVTLWGQGSLGTATVATNLVTAAKVPISKTQGAFAWAVLDEGVKARINTLYSEDLTSTASNTTQLGSGERPGVEFIDGLNGLARLNFKNDSAAAVTVKKGFTPRNFALASEQLVPGLSGALKVLTHDLSTCSVGLFTDTARGGLKQDFNLLTNATSLPSEYSKRGIYESRGVMPTPAGPADPTWESLQQFARVYRLIPLSGAPVIKSQIPDNWEAMVAKSVVNLAPPPGVVLLPTIAKVQMLFSLLGRDVYKYTPTGPDPRNWKVPAAIKLDPSNWFQGKLGTDFKPAPSFKDTAYDYTLNLLYTPVITLHNPYNVPLEFTNMKVEFLHVPFAMQVFRNGVALSTGLVPVESMHADSAVEDETFGFTLKTKDSSGKPNSTVIRLLPGEVKLFSPYIDPNRTFAQEYNGAKSFNTEYLNKQVTNNATAIPGWRGDGIGFDCNLLAKTKEISFGSNAANGLNGRFSFGHGLGLAATDKINVEFAPLSTAKANHKFTIQVSADINGVSKKVSAIEIDYEKDTGLQDFLLGAGKTLRYPSATGETVLGNDMLDGKDTPIKEIKNMKPFALLSVQAKTTHGASDPSNVDGRYATKPWCFAHVNGAVSSQKISGHPANYAYEIDLQVLNNGTANLLEVDTQDRTNFVTGHSSFNGTKFGGQYDIPLAPLQTLASLNGANPGGSSGYLPRFAQPIGNSWAHPLITPANLAESGNLDHSFLLNLALYDSFFFSGFADVNSGPTATALAADFAAGKSLNDARLVLHQPDDKPTAQLSNEINQPTGYANVAAWQMMEGAFNINSTSVQAWKAMLASIHDAKAVYYDRNTGNFSQLDSPGAKKARISRFRLPGSKSADQGGDIKDSYWIGPREFSDSQLQTLAENIVKQVRERGPFLSMAEFVNRRLGTDETAQRGALQQAIDDSGLNNALASASNAGFEIPASKLADYKYKNVSAGTGSSAQGAPGYLTQADLLNVLGNAATPRSDTFTIRGYGEARDPSGKVTASTTCEAVLQRNPEWIDSTDPVATSPTNLTSQSNKLFGRRFMMISFRWLSTAEL